ncbi:MAG: YHYH protein [Flavobacteriales bacterium]|nr:YHYH protein [Flavobacteriales bacterium]
MSKLNQVLLSAAVCISLTPVSAQTDPVITQWLFNTTNAMGSHYVAGNSTPIQDNVLANVQSVQYSNDWSYVSTHGIPAYITGPFQDGNPSFASDQNAIFKFPRVPAQNTGTPTATTGGNIGVFINGVALFDYRDGVAWNPNTNALCGGPGNPPCPGGMNAAQAWNRDAIPAERAGFDCAKGHPAMGNYHHHQNPSAFNLDLVVISDVCDLYAADGLYVIDGAQHSPLLGFAYDGFPIYGAIGYANTDGTGGPVRLRSGYQLRSITTRTTYADGTDVADGPAVSGTYPLGYFREDYEFLTHAEPFYLDEHNGRFCVTPEYPNGTYAYFCTVDANWNSAYPYVVGPTFYGVQTAAKVPTITESVLTYDPAMAAVPSVSAEEDHITVFPNPSGELIAIQAHGILRESLPVSLFDASGKLVRSATIPQGSTIWYLDTRTLYDGLYTVRIGQGDRASQAKVQVAH